MAISKREALEAQIGLLNEIITANADASDILSMLSSLKCQLVKIDHEERLRRSLEAAIYNAGGDVPAITKLIDEGMTVNDLIAILAPNGVSFVQERRQ